MPSTVSDVFAAADLEPAGVVRWRTPVPESAPGVYIVALTDDLDSTAAARPAAPLARAALEQLLAVRPELRMNLAQPDADDIIERLGGFWPGDEVVLYIGLAGQPLRTRVGQYYKTPLGARRPHAGGWWLKTLAVLDELWVHWSPTPDYARAEKRMLQAFSRVVSPASRAALLDDQRVMPFANLRGHDDRIKEHRISGATGDLPGRTAAAAVVPAARSGASVRRRAPAQSAQLSGPADTPSQRITAKDYEAGRIRLPAKSKHLLPTERADVAVNLRGQTLRARWDPRMGPPERSGVLGFGRGKLDGLVGVDETLEVNGLADNAVELR
jgi:hypothetical protein